MTFRTVTNSVRRAGRSAAQQRAQSSLAETKDWLRREEVTCSAKVLKAVGVSEESMRRWANVAYRQ